VYEIVTRYLGFREEQEGNTMALAAFGTDRFYMKERARRGSPWPAASR
jgi:predicted NodU family carbamoyl transferase